MLDRNIARDTDSSFDYLLAISIFFHGGSTMYLLSIFHEGEGVLEPIVNYPLIILQDFA